MLAEIACHVVLKPLECDGCEREVEGWFASATWQGSSGMRITYQLCAECAAEVSLDTTLLFRLLDLDSSAAPRPTTAG